MSSVAPLEVLVETLEDGRTRLACPAVGVYRHPPERSALLASGEGCGWLESLGWLRPLVVPEGAGGRVVQVAPGALGYGDELALLDSVLDAVAPPTADDASSEGGALVFRAPLAGRFFRRPAPDAEPYAANGEVLEVGRAVGLLEVMKTFSPVRFEAGRGLPERVRLVRFLAEDGEEVEEGQALAELAEAE